MQLDRYELGERLAAGGMGEVFRARVKGVRGFEKTVAIKRIYPDLAADPEYHSLFVREAQLVAHLSHPNIVQVHELGESNGELYIVMEYVSGLDVGRLLLHLAGRGEALTPPVAAIIAFDVLNALDYAHRQADESGKNLGLVHRDVSPQNILLSRDGFAKLCDFGIARVEQHTTSVAQMRGKLSYVAPEQLLAERADPRTDLFSLGVVLHELLAGDQLFPPTVPPRQVELWQQGVTHALAVAPIAKLPEPLAQLLTRLLGFKREARFPDAASALVTLEEYLITASPNGARAALAELIRSLAPPGGPHTGELPAENTASRWTNMLERAATPDVRVRATEALDKPISVRSVILRRAGLTGVALASALSLMLITKAWIAPDAEPAADAPSGTIDVEPAPRANPAPAPAADPATDANSSPSPVQPGAVADPAVPTAPTAPTREPTAKAEPAARKTASTSSRSNKEVGFLNLNTRPWAHVTIDGKKLAKPTPLLQYPLAAGEHEVKLVRSDGTQRRLTVRIKAHETVTKFVK